MSSYLNTETFELIHLPDMKEYRVIEFVRNFMPGLDDTYGIRIICVGKIFTITQSKNSKTTNLKIDEGHRVMMHWMYSASVNLVIELVETATGMSISDFSFGTIDYREELRLKSPGVSVWL